MSIKSNYSDWIGREEVLTDSIYEQRVNALAATLDCEPKFSKNDNFPPLWHWILFNSQHMASELGHDGHAQKGGFLPPIDLPRRMWAGGRFEFIKPLKVGENITRTSTIKNVSQKVGRSGQLAFVTVEHVIKGDNGGHWIEEHDIVYREAAKQIWQSPKEPIVDTEKGDWSEVVTPDPVLLFRYSALTFNGHRIHYDREYCINAEGYPGLVFHGPLTATLLINLIRKHLPAAKVEDFHFKALRPLFDNFQLTLHGRVEGERVFLWAKDQWGQRAMEAVAKINL